MRRPDSAGKEEGENEVATAAAISAELFAGIPNEFYSFFSG